MKKFILFFIFIGLSQSINALTIETISISPINIQDINVHIKSKDYYYFYYSDYQYSIQGNIITLSVCYVPTLSASILEMDNDFLIPNVNMVSNSYTLVVNLYYTNQGLCDYTIIKDTSTSQFNTPINQLIFLSSNSFSTIDNVIFMGPNPTLGKIYFDNSNIHYKNVSVYNSLGQEVIQSFVLQDEKMMVDLGGLPTGVYLVKVFGYGGNKTEKVVKE